MKPDPDHELFVERLRLAAFMVDTDELHELLTSAASIIALETLRRVSAERTLHEYAVRLQAAK